MSLGSFSVKILPRIEFREELWLPWQQSLQKKTTKNPLKNLLVPYRKGLSFHILHLASSSGALPKYFKL